MTKIKNKKQTNVVLLRGGGKPRRGNLEPNFEIASLKLAMTNKKKAQQLIEFLLVVPFMIIILGILTEYAYALNVNMTLSEGLKTATSSIYGDIKPGMPNTYLRNLVKNNLIFYLNKNNAPTNAENNIEVNYIIVGETAIFMAQYTYIPAFTLPNVYFNFLPEEFNFLATVAVPAAFLSENNYNSAISSTVLDKIWSNTASFSSQDDFNASKKGIMKSNDSINGRSKILFLIPTTAPSLTKAYALVNWSGTVLTSGLNAYNLDTSNGKLYLCSALTCSYNQMFLNYLTSNSYSSIIFVHDSETPSNLSSLSSFWVSPAGSTDLSVRSVNGILKRSLALFDISNLSVGNYDNLDVYLPLYNSDISTSSPYKMSPFGSIIFMYNPSLDNINNIKTGAPPSYVYNFGSKID